MRRRHTLPLAFAAVTALAACNAIIGLSGDYDVAGGTDGGPGTDGTTPNQDGTATDGGPGPDGNGDTGGPDASADSFVPDAPYDALYPNAWDRGTSARDAATVDAASVRYCDAPLTAEWFCWDFTGNDGVSAGNGAWSGIGTTSGTLSLSGTTGQPSHAGVATIWTDGGVAANADMYIDFNAPDPATTELILSFSFHVIQAETTARIATVSVFGADYGLGVYGGPSCYGAPCLGEIGPNSPILATATPFDDTVWYRAQVDLKRDVTNHWGATITIDNHIVTQRGSDAFPTSANQVPAGRLTFGAFETASPFGTTKVEIDDILFQVR